MTSVYFDSFIRDCKVSESDVPLLSVSDADAEMYRAGWKTKVHGSRNHRKPPVCAEGRSLWIVGSVTDVWRASRITSFCVSEYGDAGGWRRQQDVELLLRPSGGPLRYSRPLPRPKAGNPSWEQNQFECGLYIGGKHKCVEWTFFFFWFCHCAP